MLVGAMSIYLVTSSSTVKHMQHMHDSRHKLCQSRQTGIVAGKQCCCPRMGLQFCCIQCIAGDKQEIGVSARPRRR